MNNFVYVLSNESMPGLYKIGKTVNIRERLSSLDSTSTPTPFKVELLFQCENHDLVESKMHKIFNNLRIRANREFFKVDLTSLEEALNLFDGVIIDFEKIYNSKIQNSPKLPSISISIEEYHQKKIAGIERAKLEGKYKGSVSSLDEDKIAIMKRLLEDGVTKAEVARRLNVSRKTIYNNLLRM
jgi:predicted transcriptional regulator YheO